MSGCAQVRVPSVNNKNECCDEFYDSGCVIVTRKSFKIKNNEGDTLNEYFEKLDNKISMLENEIKILKKKLENVPEVSVPYVLKTGVTDSDNGGNGSMQVSSNVKYISSDENFLTFVDSPETVSGIDGNSVLTFSPSFVETLGKIDILIKQNNL